MHGWHHFLKHLRRECLRTSQNSILKVCTLIQESFTKEILDSKGKKCVCPPIVSLVANSTYTESSLVSLQLTKDIGYAIEPILTAKRANQTRPCRCDGPIEHSNMCHSCPLCRIANLQHESGSVQSVQSLEPIWIICIVVSRFTSDAPGSPHQLHQTYHQCFAPDIEWTSPTGRPPPSFR